MDEELDASGKPVAAGTNPSLMGSGVVVKDSTNAAIIIAPEGPNTYRTASFAVNDPTQIRAWLVGQGGRVPDANIINVVGSSAQNSRPLPRRDAIYAAFESLTKDGRGFDEQQNPLRNRLYVYAVGPGFNTPTHGSIFFASDGEKSEQVGVNLTDLVERVRETGTFKDVVFIADTIVDATPPPVPTEVNLPAPSKALPPTVPFYYLSCLRLDRVRLTDSLTQVLLPAWDQSPPLAGGRADTRAFVQGLADSMTALGFGPLSLRLSTMQGDASVSTHPTYQASNAGPRGARVVVDREATPDEVCLNADDYAAAVASLFSASKSGEFCFALYGPWGRGKSFLMQKVAALLSQHDSGYKAIRFSAWKYPTAPEVWVHLYEEFAKVAFAGSWLGSLPTVVRTGVAKHGVAGLLFAYLLFAFSVFPIGNLAAYATHLYPIIGLMGFVWLVGFWFSIKRTKDRLSKTYLSATRHSEKLGLQATIGNDLAALLKGWMPSHGYGFGAVVSYWAITALLIFASWTRLSDGRSVEEWFNAHNIELVVRANPGAIACITGVLFIVAFALAVRLSSRDGSPKRILLIVDDLDRCSPQHLLSVMESIKLLVEDPEISRRVQVSMLIEEDILKHAIIEKYRNLIDTSAASLPGPKQNLQVVIRENCEKLFVAHLRLPRLSSAEIYDLVGAFAGRRKRLTDEMRSLEERKQRAQQAYSRQPAERVVAGYEEKEVLAGPMVRGEQQGTRKVPDTNRPKYRSTTTAERAAEQREIDAARAKSVEDLKEINQREQSIQRLLGVDPGAAAARNSAPLDENVALTEIETDAILGALRGNAESRKNLGPRSIRSLLFQYQLARLLLIKLKIPWEEGDLAVELVRTSIARVDSPAVRPIVDEMSDGEKLRRVVEQVC